MNTYEIYYRKEEFGKTIIVQTKECTYPDRLQSYKKLDRMLDVGNIFSFGFRAKKS